MVLTEIAYAKFLGLSTIVYVGIITYALVLAAVITGLKGAPIKVHKTLAGFAIVLATVHALLVLGGQLGW